MIGAHPGLPQFDYIKPNTLKEASLFLKDNFQEAKPFLGGTDLFVRMRDGFISARYLIDIKCLDEANELTFNIEDGITIGAAVNMNQVISHPAVCQYYPALADACSSVASYQLRTRATIIGNICNASPAGDTIGACLLYNGRLFVHSVDGFKELSLNSFFLAPGKTILEPGDVVIGIKLPIPPSSSKGVYLKLGRNRLSDLSIVGVTVVGNYDKKSPSGYHFRLALASVAPVPLEVTEVSIFLAEPLLDVGRISNAAQLAENAAQPIDDIRGSARYRKEMVRVLSNRALTHVWKQLVA